MFFSKKQARAMIDRAKNKAAQEDAAKSMSFAGTRKLLSDAKQTAVQGSDSESLTQIITEVQNYCRLQIDSRKKTVAAAVPAKPLPITVSKPLPKVRLLLKSSAKNN
jgi:hypothetical protein